MGLKGEKGAWDLLTEDMSLGWFRDVLFMDVITMKTSKNLAVRVMLFGDGGQLALFGVGAHFSKPICCSTCWKRGSERRPTNLGSTRRK